MSMNVRIYTPPPAFPNLLIDTPCQIFRILGDVSHTLSKCILIWAIHSNSSAEGISLITQAFYCLVFISRYLDFFAYFTLSLWNTVLKAFYILSSLYIIFLMLRVYARTREREKAWKLGGICLTVSAVGAPLLMLVARDKSQYGFVEVRSPHSSPTSYPEYEKLTWSFDGIGILDLLHNPRICLRPTSVASPPSDNRSHRDR
jgi:hypothetical protein